jgi:hypothetical protein
MSHQNDIGSTIRVDAPVGRRDVEVALSGGGTRAAAFSLGVLMYLFDAGLGDRLRQVSSVSGGSVTNGFLANLLTEQQTIDDGKLGDFARRLADSGLPLEKLPRVFMEGLLWPLLFPP